MTFLTLSPSVSVAAQVLPHHLADLAAVGFRSVICHLPDGECGSDQPGFDQIAQAAKEVGMQSVYLPVIPGQVGVAEATAFAEAVQRLPHPVVAFCRSGKRTETVWALAQTIRR